MTSEIVTLGQASSTVILAAQLSFVIFVLRKEFAFMFQTFSRNDPPEKKQRDLVDPLRYTEVVRSRPSIV